jgi:hypothetical protein
MWVFCDTDVPVTFTAIKGVYRIAHKSLEQITQAAPPSISTSGSPSPFSIAFIPGTNTNGLVA